MKKLVLIITIILSIFTIGKVNAKEIISIDGSIENNKLNVSGKAEEGTLAVEIMVYDASNNLVYMESTSVDSDNNFAKTFNVDGNEYTIKVADYDGGNYIEKKITSNNDTSNVSNSITNKEDSNSQKKINIFKSTNIITHYINICLNNFKREETLGNKDLDFNPCTRIITYSRNKKNEDNYKDKSNTNTNENIYNTKGSTV